MTTDTDAESWCERNLVCPRDQQSLRSDAGALTCPTGHRYPVVEGIPVVLRDDVRQTIDVAERSLAAAREHMRAPRAAGDLYVDTLGIAPHEKAGIRNAARDQMKVDPVVAYLVGATSGYLYSHLIGTLERHPIPELRLPLSSGAKFLDIGCNWGRWSIAAARKGYTVVGIDPSLGAVLAARRLCIAMGLDLHFVVADARFLPFPTGSFDVAFSYSVLQHLSREDVRRVLDGLHGVLRPGGEALIQMPNRLGLRCLYHQARRGFREGRAFEVRYWSIPELTRVFESALGPTQLSVDCYFGLGLQRSDENLMRPLGRAAVRVSDGLRRASERLPAMRHVADSIYVRAVNRGQGGTAAPTRT